MPSKRHARRQHRDAARQASTGDMARAQTGLSAAAAEYRAYLKARPEDRTANRELADLLTDLARARTATDDRTGAATALTERLDRLDQTGATTTEITETGLDLAEAHLAAGHLLTATTSADDAIRNAGELNTDDPADPEFTTAADALARNARILHHTADPDLAVGAADQAARMLLAAPSLDTDQRRRLQGALAIAIELHTAAGRHGHARGAAHLLATRFPGATPPAATAPPPPTLRATLDAAVHLGAMPETGMAGRLCPDPAGREAPPAVTARCEPDLAPVALHTVAGPVAALGRHHPQIAWRLATEIHYLLHAADRQGEPNLRLNFRDHGPAWMGMLLAVAPATESRPGLAADLAGILEGLLRRLRSRHAAAGGPQAAAARFIEAYAPRRVCAIRPRG